MYRRTSEITNEGARALAASLAALSALLIGAMWTFLVTGCSLVNLEPLEAQIFPAESGALLESADTPVFVRFNTEMEPISAEKACRVTWTAGSVEGDFRWESSALFFTPTGGWVPGRRYTLSISGAFTSLDGREARFEKSVSFYAVSTSPPPCLVNYSPASFAKTGVTAEEGAALRLEFSAPMNRLSVEHALTVSGMKKIQYTWMNEQVLVVTDKDALSPWSRISWRLDASALSSEGAPLVTEYADEFTTDADTLFPAVTGVFTAHWTAAAGWVKFAPLEERRPESGEALGVEFNKPMDSASAAAGIRVEPSLAGHVEQISETAFVFVPSVNLTSEVEYTIIVSSGTKDISGKKTFSAFRQTFFSGVPYLRITRLSFWDDGKTVNTVFDENAAATEAAITTSAAITTEAAITTSGAITTEAAVSTKVPARKTLIYAIEHSETAEYIPTFPQSVLTLIAKPATSEQVLGRYARNIFRDLHRVNQRRPSCTVHVTEGIETLFAEIKFSYPLTQEEMREAALSCSLAAFFPAKLSSPAISGVENAGSDTLILRFEHVSPGTEEEPHFYKLTVSGGENGVCSGASFLKETFSIYLEVQK